VKFETFKLERQQSIWENKVDYNLSESGIHPGSLNSLFDKKFVDKINNTELTYGFTEGSLGLRKAIAEIYDKANPNNVQVFNGSAEANMVACLTLLEPGDEMIYMVPNYLQIQGFARGLGVEVKPFYLHESLNWKPELDEIKNLVSSKTKMICICNPNNPTGSVLSKNMVFEIGDIARQAGAWILVDEVYRGAELSGEECTSFWDIDYDKAIVNCGLSKAYGLPGLRLGWSIASEDYIQDAWATHDYTSIAIGRLSDLIATHVLQRTNRKFFLTATLTALRNNLDLFQKWLDNYPGKFRFITPQAGAMAFVHYEFDINSTKLVEKVRDEVSVMLVAGDWYGMDRYLRFGYGAKQDDLIIALDRIDRVFKAL